MKPPVEKDLTVTVMGKVIVVDNPQGANDIVVANAIADALVAEGYTDVDVPVTATGIATGDDKITASDGRITVSFTLQYAETDGTTLKAADLSKGGVVYLGNGTFTLPMPTDHVNVTTKDLTIIALGDTTLKGNLVIDGTGSGDYDVSISGVTFVADTASGHNLITDETYDGNLTVTDCTFTGRYGIYANNADTVSITDCVFDVTVCPFGWGSNDDGTKWVNKVIFTDNVVLGNPDRPYLDGHGTAPDVVTDYTAKKP